MERVIFWGHKSEGCILPQRSEREWREIICACAYRCFYCAQIVDLSSDPHSPRAATEDHLVPISRGGCLCRGNSVLSCFRCNTMKNKKTVAEFLNMKPALVETSGKFFTEILLVKALTLPEDDPLLNAVRRLALKKSFPDPAAFYRGSYAWRHPA